MLVIACGQATRLVRYLQGSRKTYRAEMVLGVRTTTQDAQGEVLGEVDASAVRPESLARVLASRVGAGWQVPPMVSALKRDGVPLYRLARSGREVPRAPRPVVVHRLDLLDFRVVGPRVLALVDLECSAGTYVRTLCADVGEELGVGAHLGFLVRTASGPFRLEESVSFEELTRAKTPRRWLVSPRDALAEFPEVMVAGLARRRVLNGNPVALPGGPARTVRIIDPEGRLLAMGEVVGDGGDWRLEPRAVLTEVEQG